MPTYYGCPICSEIQKPSTDINLHVLSEKECREVTINCNCGYYSKIKIYKQED